VAEEFEWARELA
jgi:hypothetical protein